MDTPERHQIDKLLEELAADRTSGAATLYRKILNYLVLGNLGSRDLPERIRALAGDMVPLSYLAGKLEKAELFSWRMVAKELLREHRRENTAIAGKLAKILPAKDSVILTHSNSSTAIEVLRSRRRQIDRIYQTISEPGAEGKASLASLREAGLTVELVQDSQGVELIAGGARPVLGADCVTENFFVNKIGSLQLVQAAIEHDMEPIVVTGTEKLIPSVQYGDRPENPLFERIPLDGIVLIAGENRFRISREKKKLTGLILKGKI
jgi:translation initiation factor 2B subunit (eIF-2B alpha/beta/delta family)